MEKALEAAAANPAETIPQQHARIRQQIDRMLARAAQMPAPPADAVPNSCCGECEDGWIREADAAGIIRTRKCQNGLAPFPSSMPYEFQQARLGNYDPIAGAEAGLEAAQEFLAAFLADPRSTRDLYLFGGVGAGKTRLACSIVNEVFAKKRCGLFVRVPQMLLDLQRIWSGRDEDREQASALIDRLEAEPLLVLDDVGVEKGSDYTRRTLYTIYEARGDRAVRTIFTSNLSLRDLKNFLGDDRLPSRLAGRAEIVVLTSGDQRMQRRGR